MTSIKKLVRRKPKGAVLIISMVFVLIFSALAVSMATLSGVNVQIADNQHKAGSALCAAHSGLEILRHHISGINISGNVSSANRLAAVTSTLQANLANAGITNITAVYDASSDTITFPSVTLNSQSGQTFSAVISSIDDDTLCIEITGCTKDFDRKVSVNFSFETIGSGVFDFGVATKGPLNMSGQAEVDGINVAIEASVYIEADGIIGDAFSITNKASVSGDVSIANPYATYSVGSQSSVGGETGEDAYDHIHIGADYATFPTPDPDYFTSFATGITIDENSDWDNDAVLNNVIVSAGTNPTFTSSVIINGIMFIESPNIVHFAGKSTINGIIVGDGQLDDDNGSSISFSGQVVCNDMSGLVGAEFDDIKQETDTFILAPGFNLDFSGQANHMSGAIAGSGISFSGQAGGTINGSIINYSQDPMTISGQSTLMFNRSGIESDPAGFLPNQILLFQPTSYSETP